MGIKLILFSMNYQMEVRKTLLQFKYEDVFYILNTTMKEEKFKKILKNYFFSKNGVSFFSLDC